MLSFFSKKKQSPETPPENIIKGQSDGNSDDFIMVDNQQSASQVPYNPPLPMMPLYPFSSDGYVPPPANNGKQPNTGSNPVSYLLGIPFNLSPQLCAKTNFEITQMEVDGILALMTKQMQFDNDYDFKLERGILSDCY